MEEGLRVDGDEIVESTGLGSLSATAQKSKARKTAYTKLLMRQLGLDQEEAADLIDRKGLDYFVEKFGSPRKTEDMDEDLSMLKKSLLGMRKSKTSQSGMMKQIEDME